MPAGRPCLTRLQHAFEELRRKHRLIVEELAPSCSTCAHAECTAQLHAQPDKIGYLFFHSQDLEVAAEDGTLWLGHDARDDMPQTVPALVACDCLREHGFEVDWNGDVRTRIKVAVPEGPERDYFKQMMEDEYAQYEEDWEEEEEEDEKGQEEREGGAAGTAEGQQA